MKQLTIILLSLIAFISCSKDLSTAKAEPFETSAKNSLISQTIVSSMPRGKVSLLLLLNQSGGSHNTADGCVAFFSNDAPFSYNIGDEDSYKFTNPDENMALAPKVLNVDSLIKTTKAWYPSGLLSINGQPYPKAGKRDTINIVLWHYLQNSYTLKLAGSGFPSNVQVFLHDNYMKSTKSILDSSVYIKPFTVDTKAKRDTLRFSLIIYNKG